MAKTVLITGSSRGIGLALVKECVKLGHKVIATCRNPAGAKELNELLAQNSQPEAVKLDVDDHASIKEAFDKVKALTSGLDILINNAGVGTKNHPIDPPTTSEPEEMMHVFSVNVVGPMVVIQTFLPLLKKDEADRSVVANISSELASISGNSFGGINAYRCSKAALNMLTKNFSFEVPDVTFVSVHPGWVQTDLGSSNGRQPPVTQPESSAGIMNLLLGYKHEDTGKFFNWQGKEMQF